MPPLPLFDACTLDEHADPEIRLNQRCRRSDTKDLKSRATHALQRRSDSTAVGLGIGLTLLLLVLLIVAYASVSKMRHQSKKEKKKKSKKCRKKPTQHYIHHQRHSTSHSTRTHIHRLHHHRQHYRRRRSRSDKHRHQRRSHEKPRQHVMFYNARENWGDGPGTAFEMPQIWSQDPSTAAAPNLPFNEMDAPQDHEMGQGQHWERPGWRMVAGSGGQPRLGRPQRSCRHLNGERRVS